jgi:hypothetical protein
MLVLDRTADEFPRPVGKGTEREPELWHREFYIIISRASKTSLYSCIGPRGSKA